MLVKFSNYDSCNENIVKLKSEEIHVFFTLELVFLYVQSVEIIVGYIGSQMFRQIRTLQSK